MRTIDSKGRMVERWRDVHDFLRGLNYISFSGLIHGQLMKRNHRRTAKSPELYPPTRLSDEYLESVRQKFSQKAKRELTREDARECAENMVGLARVLLEISCRVKKEQEEYGHGDGSCQAPRGRTDA